MLAFFLLMYQPGLLAILPAPVGPISAAPSGVLPGSTLRYGYGHCFKKEVTHDAALRIYRLW
jgi:hypothetical protein